ncbi:MAG: cell division protein ZapD [Gammaproteobacteria bacterium]|nr:MAG: cell division protein ZapD [Gammaproteobacteria bacterium]
MTDWITYEQPLNERIRTLMRLEFLFRQISAHTQHDSHWHSRSLIHSIGELLSITERGDLKSELLKELERHISTFTKLQETPGIDTDYLTSLLSEAQSYMGSLHAITGQIGAVLKNDEFLLGITQRTSIPAGTCDFDLPEFHYWLEQPWEKRLSHVKQWLSHFETLSNSCKFIMDMIRQSSLPSEETATAGSYQKSLDKSHPCQIVRVDLPADLPIFPEVSGNKQHFSIRFMEFDESFGKPGQTAKDIDFKLTICIL